MTYELSAAEQRRVENLLDFFHAELQGEYPTRIHSRDIDDGSQWGAPAYHPTFIRWLNAEYPRLEHGERSDGRTRITRALRRVRKVAPREYFVLSLILANGMTLNEAQARMNEREMQRDSEDRYTNETMLLLLLAGLDKLYKWYDR